MSSTPSSAEGPERGGIVTTATDDRCLISNVHEGYAVEYVHALRRSSSNTLLTQLECAFGMVRGTLNVDTRLNTFKLASNLRCMFEKGWLFFIPEKKELTKYLNGGKPDLKYDGENQISYKYKLVASPELFDFPILRTDNSQHIIYSYPFTSFPVLESHVHPVYMICHFGQATESTPFAVIRANPHLLDELTMTAEIYERWTRALPSPEFLANFAP
ncbi:hypothetical protein BDN70DRAFT_875363 [Pholiota conissans]|uniref:HNH nuclease domain-containing protein n=1 Tax=Pholiota conissans TaxID=109636 RepID=A0A9P5Z765_9AGAR|nr:hypothetical protein BDN70DRAFT_875363 [Pholiota conissans]